MTSNAASSGRHTYFPHIDGLRALAVLSVVIYHLDARWLPGGFSGVDIFFVISGFIVSASVGARAKANLPAFATFFIARRLQRIAPALLACLLLTTLFTALLVPEAWLSEANQKTGHYAFFGLSNVILARTSHDYFSPIADFNPYMHTWSLGVEEQFYLLFPAMFFLWSYARRWRSACVGLFGVALLASAVYSAVLGAHDATAAFYLIGSRFWELAAGVLLYQLMVLTGRDFGRAEQDLPRWFRWGALASVLVIALNFVLARPNQFPFPGALLSVIGTLGALFFMHGNVHRGVLARLLTCAPARYIGRISYSLYLWHWPVFVLFRWTVGTDTAACRIGALVIASALAVLSYHFVETPFRKAGRIRSASRWRVVAAGLLCIGAASWVGRKIDKSQPHISLSTVTQHAGDWYPLPLKTDAGFPGCEVNYSWAALETGFTLEFTRSGCHGERNGIREFVVGDSHAMTLQTMFTLQVMSSGDTLKLYNNGGCPFMSLQPWREDGELCRRNAAAVMKDLLANLHPGDVVFLPSLRLPRYVDEWVRYPASDVESQVFGPQGVEGRAAALPAAEKALRAIQATGARVVIQAPVMVLKEPPFRCAESFSRSNAICAGGTTVERAEVERLRGPALKALRSLAYGVPNVSIWDPLPVLCPPDHRECRAYSNGRPLFFDGDHLSGYANRLLQPSFARAVAGTNVGEASSSGVPSTANASPSTTK
jgi:peptidoglycan/LPS O-acetylase OafA/YrhL